MGTVLINKMKFELIGLSKKPKAQIILSLLFLLLNCFSKTGYAADSNAEVLKFKTSDSDKEKILPEIIFKVGETPKKVDTKAQTNTDSARSIEDKLIFQSFIEYPKYSFLFSYDSQIASFKQALASSKFEPNFSSTSYNGYTLGTRVSFSPTFFVEAIFSNYGLKTSSQGSSTLSVESGSVEVESIDFRGVFCRTYGLSFHRFCYGAEIGSESIPTLEFKDSATLRITKIRDYLIGPIVYYEYPPSPFYLIVLKAGYKYGLGIGQNDILGVKSQSRYFFESGFEKELNKNNKIGFHLDYILGTGKVAGLRGTFSEQWNITSSNLGIKIAYEYLFN